MTASLVDARREMEYRPIKARSKQSIVRKDDACVEEGFALREIALPAMI
jgi:hypothetical protein